MSNKEHKTIFIAILADVLSDIEFRKELEDEFNCTLEDTPYRIDLRCYKDILGGEGEPQATINEKLVNQCDLFLGVLWKSWPEPDCNFRSEYDLALQRKKAIGKPHNLHIFFKQEDDSKLAPGLKLFKSEINQRNLYKVFSDSENLKSLFRNSIQSYIYSLFPPTSGATSASSRPPSQGAMTEGHGEGDPPQSTSKKEEFAKRKTGLKALVSNLYDCVSVHKNFDKLDSHNRTRLFLLSTALFYSQHLHETLGNHEVQHLYSVRDDLDPSGVELDLLFRTILDDPYDHRCGWFWLKRISSAKFDNLLLWYLHSDEKQEVRLGVLRVLSKRWKKKYLKYIHKSLKEDGFNDIKSMSLEVLGKYGDEKSLKLVDETILSAGKDISEKATAAKLSILSRVDPVAAVACFFSMEVQIRDELPSVIKGILSRLSEEDLRKLLLRPDTKEMAFEELLKRKVMARDDVIGFQDSDRPEIKYSALMCRLNSGDAITLDELKNIWNKNHALSGHGIFGRDDLKDRVALAILNKLPLEQIKEQVSWLSGYRDEAYYTYYSRERSKISEVREDLGSDFRRVQDEYRVKIRGEIEVDVSRDFFAKFPTTTQEQAAPHIDQDIGKILKPHLDSLVELESFIVQQLRISALKVLTDYGDDTDIKYARRYILENNTDIKRLSLQLIRKYGSADDIPILCQVVTSSHGETKHLAGQVALELDKPREAALELLLKSDDAYMIQMALEHIRKGPMKMTGNLTGMMWGLLYSKNDDIRMLGLGFYVGSTPHPKKLVSILKRYVSQETYYYDVVCWLDRLLYMPRGFREVFQKQLLSKASDWENKSSLQGLWADELARVF